MIDWTRPVLVNGKEVPYRFAGMFNDVALIILTDNDYVQTLYKVWADGSSTLISHRPGETGRVGPTFSNVPEEHRGVSYLGLHKDGMVVAWETLEGIHKYSERPLAVWKVTVSVGAKTGPTASIELVPR